jgi:predicted PurR-regulated permease PerM
VTAPAGRTSVITPDWLVNLAALGWRVLAIVGLVVMAWLLASLLWTVTASIAIGGVIAASFAPFVLRLQRRGRSRTGAAAIVWVAALAIVGGVVILLGFALLPYAGELVAKATAGIADLEARLAALNLPPVAGEVVQRSLDAARAVVSGFVDTIVGAAAGTVTVLILAAFLVFFFLKDGDKAWVWIFQAVSDQKRERITAAGEDALTRVGGYLRGTTLLSAIIAATDYVFMVLLGVPLALPLAVLVFFSGYIPYFGGVITTALILLVTLATLGLGPVVALLVLIGVRNSILGYLVRPAVYGRAVSIHPALVLIALPAGFQLAGIVGLFAAVPATAVVLAVARATVAIVDPGPRPDLPALVPSWLDRLAQWSWRLLVGVGLAGLFVALFVAVPLVLIPIVLATILAATLNPLVRAMVARGRGRGQASAIAIGGGFLAIVLLMVLTIASLAGQAGAVRDAAVSGAGSMDTATGGALGLFVAIVEGGGVALVQLVASIGSALAGMAVTVILSTMLAFYFLKDGGGMWRRIVARVRPEARAEVGDAAGRAFDILSGYMSGTGAISLVGAGSQLLIMVLLGIPLALPIFVLSFFLCFIPYIGGFISTGLAVLVTVAVGSPVDIAVMAAWTVVFNIVTGNVVAPLVYGRTVHLHPAIVLVAIPAGAAIGGILGMFLVVPVIGVIATTWRTVVAIIGMPRVPATVTAEITPQPSAAGAGVPDLG